MIVLLCIALSIRIVIMYLSVNISNALNCLYIYQLFSRGRSWIYFKLPVQSVPITTKAVSLNPADGDM